MSVFILLSLIVGGGIKSQIFEKNNPPIRLMKITEYFSLLGHFIGHSPPPPTHTPLQLDIEEYMHMHIFFRHIFSS